MLQGTENIIRITSRSLVFLSLLNRLAGDDMNGAEQGNER